MGNGQQAQYIKRYMNSMGAWTIVVEHDYIDKDYLIDFSKFYARSFKNTPSKTKRVQFFNAQITRDGLASAILGDDASVLQQTCLGYVVVKPIKKTDCDGSCNIIGRSALSTYGCGTPSHRRTYLTDKQRASLYGHELTIESLPFQSKDLVVGMCASAALWMSMHRLAHAFEIERSSLYEITEVASKGDPTTRAFPSNGLNLHQLCYYLRSKCLEVEVVNIEASIKEVGEQKTNSFIKELIKAHLRGGLPVIAVLEMDGLITGLHAVVISGYCVDGSVSLNELYVHDDEIGPYTKVFPSDTFIQWKYGDVSGWMSEIHLRYLVIPLYHKIRYPFGDIFDIKGSFQGEGESKVDIIFYE